MTGSWIRRTSRPPSSGITRPCTGLSAGGPARKSPRISRRKRSRTAYRRRSSYLPESGSLRSWFYGIATNLLRNHWRAEKRLLERDAQLPVQGGLATYSEAADDRVIDSMLAPRLAAALLSLTPEQHEVLLLHAWAELSHEEIAAALRIATGTARSRLARARATLREQLGMPGVDLWVPDGPGRGQEREGDSCE